MIYVALLCAFFASFSGMKVIGNGRDWKFTFTDLLRGRQNALAYVWVTCSTCFSVAHACVIGFWVYIEGAKIIGLERNTTIMSLHALMGVLFTLAHMFVKAKLKVERGEEPRYLWGN